MGAGWVGLCLYPEVKFRIVSLFVRNPDLRQNQTQIARSIRSPIISVSRHIRDLVKLRVLHEERHGKAAVYSLNSASVLAKRFLAQVVSLNAGLIPDWVQDQLSSLPRPLKQHVDRIILFGSAARGELRASSDIDLLAVVTRKSEQLRSGLHARLVAGGSEAGFNVNLQIELLRNFDAQHSSGYLQNAKSQGVVIWRK
jgi:hypothetical protein